MNSGIKRSLEMVSRLIFASISNQFLLRRGCLSFGPATSNSGDCISSTSSLSTLSLCRMFGLLGSASVAFVIVKKVTAMRDSVGVFITYTI